VEFENSFTVQAPIDEVYEALLDLERVTPAMPGAQVLEKTGEDSYKVAIKVKLGPVSMTYRGDVTIVERDPSAHSAVLEVKAKEARGQGSANATVTMALREDGGATAGTMKAHVQLAGKAAAMGRGVIEDVSRRLVQTFADNLEGILGSEEVSKDEPPVGEPAAGGPTAAEPVPDAKPAARAPAEDAGLSVVPIAAGVAADRLKDPRVLAGVLGGALFVGYLLGRRSG
jgi:carbon monoxide dehydrogenase subunit G